jgi:hypothetical protein
VNDGNYWYHLQPPNRWTCSGSTNQTDSLAFDLGTPRRLDTIKFYFLDDGTNVVSPLRYEVEAWDGASWKAIPGQRRSPEKPSGHRANVVQFLPLDAQKLRAVFTHAAGGRTGLTEVEVWGEGSVPYVPAPPPSGNVAYNPTGRGFPKATASFSDRFGGVPELAIDGKVIFGSTPLNRWTSFGSTNSADWLEIDFGGSKVINRAELYIYDDRGGVQAPADYNLQYWSGEQWRDLVNQVKVPGSPIGNMGNSVGFDRVTTTRVRVILTHKGKARSGLTEIQIWEP